MFFVKLYRMERIRKDDPCFMEPIRYIRLTQRREDKSR
jgi:hypothetical protein